MDDRSDDSIGDIGYLDPVQIQNASLEELKRTVVYLHQKYGEIYQELQARNAEVDELQRMNAADETNFQIVNHGFEVNSQINRIRAEYTEKMKQLVAGHELQMMQTREKYQLSLKEIETEIRGQSRQSMIEEIDEKCMKFIQDMRIKQEDLERTKQELELGRQQDRNELNAAQQQNHKIREEVSALKNDQVLKAAQIATLQSQLESERARLEHQKVRLRQEQERTINERVAYEQEKFRKDQEQYKREQERFREEEQRQKGKLSTTVEEGTRLKNLLEDQRSKCIELERYNNQLREKFSMLTEEAERQKAINDNFRQFAEKKETESKRIAEELKKTSEENARLKQQKNNQNEGMEKEVERLNARLRGLVDEFHQERQNIEQRYANQLKVKLDESAKVKDLEMDQLRLDIEVKSREVSRLQGKISEVEMLNKCNVNLITQKNSLCEKQLQEINKKSKEIRLLQNEITEHREKDQVIDRLNQDLRDKDKTIIALEQQIRECMKKMEKMADDYKVKERKVTSLEQQLEESSKTIEKLNGQLTAKEKVAGRYEQSNKQIDRNVASLTDQLRTKNQAITKYEQQLLELTKSIEGVSQQNSLRNRQIAALQLQIKESNTKIADKNKSLQELTISNTQLELRERESKEAHDKTKRELDRLNQRVRENEVAIRQSEQRIQQQEVDLKSTSRSYGEQLQKLTTELQNYESKLRESEAREHLLKQELGKAKQKMKVLQKDKASAEKVQEYKDLLQSTTSLNESINEELKKSHKRVLELEQQLNEDRDRNRFRSEPMETKLREAEKDVMTLQGELSQNKLHLGNLTNEKRFLEIKLEELRKDRDNLASTSKAKLERYDEQLKQRDQNHASDKAYLNEQLSRARQNLESLSNKQTETKLENQMLKSELESLTKNLAATIEQQKGKITDNQTLRRKIRTLEEQCSKLTASQRLPLQRDDSASEKTFFVDRLAEDRNGVMRIRQQSEDRNMEISRLRQQLEEKLAENIRLKQQLDKLTAERELEQIRLKTSSQQSDDVTRELVVLRREADSLQNELQKSQLELTNLKQNESKRNSATQSELERAKASLSGLTRQLADSKRETNLQTEKVEQLKREKKDLERLLNQAEQTILEESSKAKRMSNTFQIRQQDDLAKDNLERLQQYCDSIKSKSKEEIDRLTAELQQLHGKGIEDRRLFEHKLAKFRQESEVHLNEVSARHELELKKYREERAKIKEEVNRLNIEKGKFIELVDELKGTNGRLSRQLQLKEDKLVGLQAQIEKTGSQLSSESSAQTLLKQHIRKLEAQVADRSKLQAKVVELEGRCRQLNELRADSESKLLDQEGQLTEATNSITRLKKELASIQKAHSTISDQLTESERIVAQLRGKLQSRQQNKNSELQSMFSQVQRLNSMLVEKEREVGDLKSLKSAKVERKRSIDKTEKQVQFSSYPAIHQSAQLQPQTQQQVYGSRSNRTDSNREVARTADECWDDIQGRIQAVRQQNQRLKNYVGGSLR